MNETVRENDVDGGENSFRAFYEGQFLLSRQMVHAMIAWAAVS